MAYIFIFAFCGVLGANIVGQLTIKPPVPQVVFILSGLAFMTNKKWLWKIDLLLIRRIILIVGITTLISGSIVWVKGAENYLQSGLQTLPTHLLSLAALITTLYFHYILGGLDYKTRAYVLQNGEYQKVAGPTELLNGLSGIGGYIVIGDEVSICSTIYYSRHNHVTNQSINGYSIPEMELTQLDDKDKKNLGLI